MTDFSFMAIQEFKKYLYLKLVNNYFLLQDMNIVKVFVIDDHFLITDGFNAFQPDVSFIKVVGCAGSIDEALKILFDHPEVEVIILDLYLKFSDPIQNLKALKEKYPLIPVIILTIEDDIVWKIRMFRHGVYAYINKGENKDTVTGTILQVAHGYKVIPVEVDEFIKSETGDEFDIEQKYRKSEIIKDLQQGLTIKEIAYKHNLSISSIEKILIRMRLLYGARTNTEMIYKISQSKK